ncbi:MAG TPA: putative metal-dependent hydrolase [Blastocatellia bacterium]|nr:putative metal-dependent hydrolase [Blastocatellia bacterium]
MSDLRFPIGKCELRSSMSPEGRRKCIDEIAAAPAGIRAAVSGLNQEQMETPYRPGGWTVRQVVHHVPDSHLNSYTRFKLALTEDEPTIRPYREDRWAELADSKTTPIEVSMTLLESLHQRWAILLSSMDPADFQRTLRHPEIGTLTLDAMLDLYSWHGKHHAAHITTLRERQGW